MNTAISSISVPKRVFAAISLLIALIASGTTNAQVQPVDPYHVAVTANDAMLRSGEGTVYYVVAKLKAGQVLRVLAEDTDWRSVQYPAGLPALIKADEAEITADGKSVRLTRPSKLKARNEAYGIRGSWKPLFTDALPAGTIIPLADPARAMDPDSSTYSVLAPKGARGFIHASSVRRATDEEARAFLGGNAADVILATPEPVKPEPIEPKPEPVKPADNNLLEPIVIAQEDQQEEPIAPAQDPTIIDQSELAARTPRPVATPEALDSAFQEVIKLSVAHSEVDELIAEFQRSIDALGGDPTAQYVKSRLAQRLELLKLRADLKKQLAAMDESEQNLDLQEQQLASRLEQVRQMRHYNVVGRLTTSSIYDGKRLDLMFRVLSVGPGVHRTLGYIKNDPNFDLRSKIGNIVGVSGDANLDSALQLLIIQPKHVDVLTPGSDQAAVEGDS